MTLLTKTEILIKKLMKAKMSIAVAESCTGGYISNMITNISGASNVFERGIICYSNKSKIDLLNVEPEIIEKHGAVSELVARQLALNVRLLSNSNIGISTTGIAGPTGGTSEKPIGLVYIGISSENETIVKKYQLSAERMVFKEKVFEIILSLLENIVNKSPNSDF